MIAGKLMQLSAIRFGAGKGYFRSGDAKRGEKAGDAPEFCESLPRQFASSEGSAPVDTSCMPLALVSPGSTVAIHSIQGGDRLRQRLIDLGLNRGARIRVVKNDIPGPLIIAVKEDGRLALGRGMTQRILVTQPDADAHAGVK